MTARKRPARKARLPSEDALLSVSEVASLIGIGRKSVTQYAQRFPVLVDGMRIVRVDPKTKGRRRWLRSAVVKHLHEELLRAS